MSNDERVGVRMILGARGEDGVVLEAGKDYEVSARFARQLIHSGKAEVVELEDQDEAKPKKKGK